MPASANQAAGRGALWVAGGGGGGGGGAGPAASGPGSPPLLSQLGGENGRDGGREKREEGAWKGRR